jgi:hypothetical protein
MNWAWWDGKMPIEHYRHEHELDKESIAAAEAEAAGQADSVKNENKPEAGQK